MKQDGPVTFPATSWSPCLREALETTDNHPLGYHSAYEALNPEGGMRWQTEMVIVQFHRCHCMASWVHASSREGLNKNEVRVPAKPENQEVR